jgi:hypothetical protein
VESSKEVVSIADTGTDAIIERADTGTDAISVRIGMTLVRIEPRK